MVDCSFKINLKVKKMKKIINIRVSKALFNLSEQGRT
jgi:hypothetical protein